MDSKVELSRSVKISTTFALVITLPFMCVMLWISSNTPNEESTIAIGIVLGILLGILVTTYLYAPKSISLTDKHLLLRRRVGNLYLPYAAIAEVELYNRPKGFADIRVFGSGGFFGHIGRFYNRKIGYYTANVGDYTQTFLIHMKSGKKYLLSCQNPQEMVSALKERCGK